MQRSSGKKVRFQLCLRDEVPAHGEQAAVAVSPGVAAEEPVRLLALTLALQAAGIYLLWEMGTIST